MTPNYAPDYVRMKSREPESMYLNPDTAPAARSIWKGTDRNALEAQARLLHKKQHVAGCRSYARKSHSENDRLYRLPFEVERNLADDFAFIAASQPQVEYVTAVAIEQKEKIPSFIIKLAANEGVSQDVRRMFDELLEVLRKHANKDITRESCQEEVFDLIARLNCNKVLGRLGSIWFRRPAHLMKTRQPLPARIRTLFRNNTHNSLERHDILDHPRLDRQIANFETALKRLDEGRPDEIVCNVKNAIRQAFHLTEDGVKLPDRLRALGCPDACLDARDVREVGKVSNYWRIARHLTICSHRFRTHFANVEWIPLPSYRSSTTSKVRSPQFVHAEIQLLVHYELTAPELMPRAIGCSKEACFLCDSFIRAHGRFSVTGAHRQIFPQWTVPDLEEYSLQTTQRFSRALAQVCTEVKTEYLRSQRRHRWHPCPLQSAINLNVILLSTPATSTLLSHEQSYSSQHNGIDESGISCSASTASGVTRAIDVSEGNEEVDLHGANFTSMSRADEQTPDHPAQALIEAPVEIIADTAVSNHDDWVHTSATFSHFSLHTESGSRQQRFVGASILLEPAPANRNLRRIHLPDIPEEGLVLDKDPGDALNELSFVLVGSGGKELRFRCRWHI